MERNLKGKSLLKVTGILMIIGGGISVIVSIIALLGIGILIAAGLGSGVLYVAGILLILGAVAELIAGISGVKNCNKAEKAGACLTWGIIIIVLSIIGSILDVIGGQSFPIMSCLIGLILPVLYIIGAIKNKQEIGIAPAAPAEVQEEIKADEPVEAVEEVKAEEPAE